MSRNIIIYLQLLSVFSISLIAWFIVTDINRHSERVQVQEESKYQEHQENQIIAPPSSEEKEEQDDTYNYHDDEQDYSELIPPCQNFEEILEAGSLSTHRNISFTPKYENLQEMNADTSLTDGFDNENTSTYFPKINENGNKIHCHAKSKIAIIIPYRNRINNLKISIPYLIKILKKQNISFKIFIIEQAGQNQTQTFNRGKLLNVGTDLVLKDMVESEKSVNLGQIDPKFIHYFNCIIFHDVDMILLDETLSLECDDVHPVHLAAKRFEIKNGVGKVPLHQSFGAVSSVTPEMLRTTNGYSNKYSGWGGEDDDFYQRLIENKYRAVLDRCAQLDVVPL